ncbi:MAG: HAMP domain-containing sensor histidine kinase [Armatimonadota bacterium]|nr:HAMP domain-containing sensor histidine kinase [Armatimonadota bacterium]
MRLRRRIAMTIAVTLGIVEAVLGVAFFVELERFLLDHTVRGLRAQSLPVITAYTRRAGTRPIAVAEIAAPLARALTSPDVTAIVMNTAGEPLASGQILPESLSPEPPGLELVRGVVSGESSDSGVRASVSGREIVVVLPLRADDGAAVGAVALVSPLNDVDGFLARIRWWLAATAATVMVVGCILALLFASHLAAPLETLTATSRAIADGAWGRRSELQYGTDEVGRLAESFDAMIHRLEKALEAQHRFVANAAHQLKTPLTVLGGHLELLARGMIVESDRVSASYRVMRGQVERLADMVQKLLTLSSLDAGVPLQRRPTDLVEIPRELLEAIRPLIGGRRLEIATTGDTRAYVDPDQVREAVSNLLDNAIRHTAPDGFIVVEVGDGRITVRDNGVGIPADRLDRIFDRFYRHPPTGDGHGLGLAIVRSIAEAHGGMATAQSEPGVGTAMTLVLHQSAATSGWRQVDPRR